MSRKLLIFGTGELAEIAHLYFTQDSDYEVVAFVLDQEHITDETYKDLPVVSFEKVTHDYPPAEYEMFVAIAYKGVNKLRAAKVAEARGKGYRLATYVSSRAIYWPETTSFGENCFIFELNNIQPFVKVGENVIMWSGNHVGHHSVIEDDCFLTSHCVVSGGVTLGKGSFLGVNCTLRDHITIGHHTIIGAGVTILKDTGDEEVYSSKSADKHALKSTELKNI